VIVHFVSFNQTTLFFPFEQFLLLQKFPKIKQYEGVVCHGTEFPIGEENQPMLESSLFHHISIADTVTVQFELVHGENFTVLCSSKVHCFDK